MSGNTKVSSTLSETQADLLQSAVSEGYFEMPRKVSTLELADRHGMSDKEFSKQLNQGLDAVIRDAILDG